MIEQSNQLDLLLFPGRRVLSVREVAERLSIGEQQVRDLIEEGKIMAINIGGHARKFWRIPVDEYERFLRENCSLVLAGQKISQ
jgi:excisionase family DNA binding protein